MRSESVTTLTKALVKVQAALRPAQYDRTNPAFKSRYATLAALWEAARGPLTANGLAVVQAVDEQEHGSVLVTTLYHESGEWVSSVMRIAPTQNTPQAYGSALTYARRYSLSALIGLVADDDDDGNTASAPRPAEPQYAPKANGNGKAAITPSDGIRKALHARGTEIFGGEWDDARHWMIGAWTAKHTPAQRRNSSAALTDEEMAALVSDMNKFPDALKLRWWQYKEAAAVTVENSPELAP